MMGRHSEEGKRRVLPNMSSAEEEPVILMMTPECAEHTPTHAGLVAEDLEPLQLSRDQHLALLNMLLQTRRMRLVMRDGKRTYTLPR